jgi:excisionase family DNA binding protein
MIHDRLAERSQQGENFTHEEVFGHLAEHEFSSQEAADYLEVSMSTFRRYVRDGKISASTEVGKNLLFATKTLKAFKRSLREVKGPDSR